MVNDRKKKRNLILAAAAVLVVIIFIAAIPIEIPDTITVEGKILAAHEWLMVRQTDGSVLISRRDNRSDFVNSYTAFQVDRGDVFQFLLDDRYVEQRTINTGDTLGRIFSHRLYQEISRLEGLLGVAEANQMVLASGEKEALINQARNEYELNVERAAVQAKILERQTKLYDDALISNEEYEITSGLARIAELEAQVADARLKALMTGEKPAQIRLASSEIYAASRELSDLKNKLSRFTLVSPIDGQISTAFSADTMLLISSTERVALMPIPDEYFQSVSDGQSFKAHDLSLDQYVSGTIEFKGSMLRKLGTGQVFFAVGNMEGDASIFPLGMITRYDIEARPKLLSEYITRFIKTLFW